MAKMTKQPTDTQLLDFMESHPEAAIREIESWWAQCGRGFRESFFSFRARIRDAMKAEKDQRSSRRQRP